MSLIIFSQVLQHEHQRSAQHHDSATSADLHVTSLLLLFLGHGRLWSNNSDDIIKSWHSELLLFPTSWFQHHTFCFSSLSRNCSGSPLVLKRSHLGFTSFLLALKSLSLMRSCNPVSMVTLCVQVYEPRQLPNATISADFKCYHTKGFNLIIQTFFPQKVQKSFLLFISVFSTGFWFYVCCLLLKFPLKFSLLEFCETKPYWFNLRLRIVPFFLSLMSF